MAVKVMHECRDCGCTTDENEMCGPCAEEREEMEKYENWQGDFPRFF